MKDVHHQLRYWRSVNGIKQQALAEMLGISQSSVSRWERGIEQPSVAMSKKLRDVVYGGMKSELARQRAITERQPVLAALVDLDGMRLLATSYAFKEAWPEAAGAEGKVFADDLAELTRDLFNDDGFMQAVRHNEIAMVTGISNRHVEGFGENGFRHHWASVYRKVGTKHYAEMSFQACEPDEELGLRHVLRIDEIGEG